MGIAILLITGLGLLVDCARISTDIIKVNWLRRSERWTDSRLYFLLLWGQIGLGCVVKLGKTTLGWGYGTAVAEFIVGPAIPSNTARGGGVMAPIVNSLARTLGSSPEDQPKRVFDITHPNTTYEFIVLCLDRKTGKTLWRRVATKMIPHEGTHRDNNFASASPTTDGERLYCWFGSAGLFCYDLEGKKLWERNLGKAKVGASLGEGCSPVVHKGKLVVLRDHQGQRSEEHTSELQSQ